MKVKQFVSGSSHDGEFFDVLCHALRIFFPRPRTGILG
jgi:hypothetical protein